MGSTTITGFESARKTRTGTSGRYGFTSVEVVLVLVILTAVAVVMTSQFTSTFTGASRAWEESYATKKAIAILEEVRMQLDSGKAETAADLERWDDGQDYNPVLALAGPEGEVLSPDHPLSSNCRHAGAWMWSRRIEVGPHRGSPDRRLRYVTVKVYRRGTGGEWLQKSRVSAVLASWR